MFLPMSETQVPMRDTGDCGGEPSLVPDGATPQPRGRSAGGREAPGDAVQDVCPALADLHHMHYRSLFRLAALLTGDPRTAEAVVADAFAAIRHPRTPMLACGGLPRLHRLVVARSRRAVRHRRLAREALPPGTPRCPGSPQEAPRFETDAVVLALRALPASQREAIVLTLYLDLTDEQAAAAMRVSRSALRRSLAAARGALRAALTADR